MGLSRQARIITLLVIDSVFFLVELVTGYAVGSLALVADSFHMLNDVLSLIVALYTIKLATSPSSNKNSYGWQRAEILGALINGVFLVALCVSIALEALGRIIAPPEISNPMVIVIVGSLGLLSNIVGLFLFHEHGHGGHSHGHPHGPVALPPDNTENETHPQGRQRADSMSSLYQHPAQTRAQVIETAHEFGYGKSSVDYGKSGEDGFGASPPVHHGRAGSLSRRSQKHGSMSRTRGSRGAGSVSAVPPAPGTNEVRPPVVSPPPGEGTSSASTATAVADDDSGSAAKSYAQAVKQNADAHTHEHNTQVGKKHVHMAPDANHAEEGAGGHGHSHDDHGHGGHSHGSMNMQGVFLHVLGDALGNVGVIAAGLVIWFCHGRWTLYFDPGVSLLITCIIFSSAVPLVKSASYILMQAVPSHVSLDEVRFSIKQVSGVVSVHELHVWQLSESTVVASVHVLISPGADYMAVAAGIREAMHGHGIHSVTIQPEFYAGDGDSIEDEVACLIRCPPEQCGTDTCCPPTPSGPKTGELIRVDEHDEHNHEGHNHDGHAH